MVNSPTRVAPGLREFERRGLIVFEVRTQTWRIV
jgi:hypothetical protein